MNDRFRFRVWHEPKGITRDEPIMIYNAEDTYDCMTGNPAIIYKSCFGDVLEDDEYTVMQCTGLKDKNGKLIYEGDIVKETSTDFINFFRRDIIKVEWDNSKASYNFVNLQNSEKEVIGNVYENKELLDERN